MSFLFRPPKTSGSNNSNNSGSNLFMQKPEIMSKIARTISSKVAAWMREGNWSNFRSDYSNYLNANVYVHDDCIYIEVPSGSPGRKLSISPIPFSVFGMTDITTAIPEVARGSRFAREKNRKDFLYALKPHLDVYFPQAINEKFAGVSPAIKRSTAVEFEKIVDAWDYDSPTVDSICLKLIYSMQGSTSRLTSWG